MNIQNMPRLDTLHACYNGIILANAVKSCFDESLPTKIFFERVIKDCSPYKASRDFLSRYAAHTVSEAELSYLTEKVSRLVLSRCLIQWRVAGKTLKEWLPSLYHFFDLINRFFYSFLEKVGLDDWIHAFIGARVEKSTQMLLRPLVEKMVKIIHIEIGKKMIDKGTCMFLDWIGLLAITSEVGGYIGLSRSHVALATSGIYGVNCTRKFIQARRQLMTREQMKEFLSSLLEKKQKEFYALIENKIKSLGFDATHDQISTIVRLAQTVIVNSFLFFFDTPNLSD